MVREITVEQLEAFLREGAELIDVREQDETVDGGINGGKNWPLSTFGLRQIEISRGRPTIFYCRSGIRSLKAAEIAEQWTDQELYSLKGGYLEFKSQKTD